MDWMALVILTCYLCPSLQVCSTCKRIIAADSPGLSHGEFHWHACPHCFSCHCCKKNLINQQFLLKDGRLFCSTSCRHVYDTSPKNAFPRDTREAHCHWLVDIFSMHMYVIIFNFGILSFFLSQTVIFSGFFLYNVASLFCSI